MGSLTRAYSCKRPALVTAVFSNSQGSPFEIKKKKSNFYLPSAEFIAQVPVGPSKQLKQVFQIEHNIVKDPNWPETNQLAIYNRGRGFEGWSASPRRWPLGHAAEWSAYDTELRLYYCYMGKLTWKRWRQLCMITTSLKIEMRISKY